MNNKIKDELAQSYQYLIDDSNENPVSKRIIDLIDVEMENKVYEIDHCNDNIH